MANIKSAQKRIRQTLKRTAINRSRVSRIRTFVKRVELALDAGDAETAANAFQTAEPELRRGVTKGVLHRNTASRKISRLAKRIAKLKAVA
ncbi:MAG: 30S ribosomal protein S20 [Geminicoccaceae bacterium]